jgi:hypothetical protein
MMWSCCGAGREELTPPSFMSCRATLPSAALSLPPLSLTPSSTSPPLMPPAMLELEPASPLTDPPAPMCCQVALPQWRHPLRRPYQLLRLRLLCLHLLHLCLLSPRRLRIQRLQRRYHPLPRWRECPTKKAGIYAYIAVNITIIEDITNAGFVILNKLHCLPSV